MRTVTYLKKIVTLTLSLVFILQSTAFGAYTATQITFGQDLAPLFPSVGKAIPNGSGFFTASDINGYGGLARFSSDGTTWQNLPVINPLEYKGGSYYSSGNNVAVSDDATKIVATYAGPNGGRSYLYTSSDSGLTWTRRISVGEKSWSSVASSSNGIFLIASESSGYIYTSSDSGANWTERTSPGSRGWTSVAVSDNGSQMVAASSSYIYTSSDGGETWVQRQQGFWNTVTSSSDGTKLAAAYGSGYIYTSSDGGATWVERTDAGSQYWGSLSSSSDGTRLFVIGASSGGAPGFIYTSSDSGATWSPLLTLGQKIWSSVSVSNDGLKVIAVTRDDNSVHISLDAGATWNEKKAIYWDSPMAVSSDGTKILAANRYGYLYTSSDSGATWVQRSPSSGGPFDNWGSSSFGSSSDGSKLFASYGSYKFSSSDSGISWSPLWSSFPSSLVVSSDGTKLFGAYGSTGVGISLDSGQTWSTVIPAGASSIDIVSSSSDGVKLVSGYGGFGGGYLYTSSDGGATWVERTSAGQRQWSSIGSSSDGTKLIAANRYGYLYTSSDSGATWTELTNGPEGVLPNTKNERVLISENGERIFVLSGPFCASAYISDDFGATWQNFSLPRGCFGNSFFSGLVASSDLSVVYISDFFNNVFYRLSDPSLQSQPPTPPTPTPTPTTRTPIPLTVLRALSQQNPQPTPPPQSQAPSTGLQRALFVIGQRLTPAQNRSEIQRLQQFLNTNGFTVSSTGAGSPGRETTTFGPATRRALQRFQRANGISPTGTFGPQTRAKINSMMN